MKQFATASLLSLLSIACGYDALPAPYASNTLDGAGNGAVGGKADQAHPWMLDGEDMCATFELYDNGRCDSYCPERDPECDPSVYVEPEKIDCSYETLTCAHGEVLIDTDDNTCGDTCVVAQVGCATNDDCAKGDYCARPMGDCSASVGTCEPMPTCEIDPEEWKPSLVCACDGVTYAMACDAASIGVNVEHEGMCAWLESLE